MIKKWLLLCLLRVFIIGLSENNLYSKQFSQSQIQIPVLEFQSQKMYWGPPEFQGFANIAGMMKECWNFLWGVISGGTRAPFNIIFIVQSPKFLKSMFFVTSGTSVIGINYHLCRSGSSGICFWPANRAIVVGFWWFLHHWKALFKVDEEWHTFRGLGTILHNGNSTCSPPKVEFQFNSPSNLTIHCCTPKMWKKWVTQVS